MAKSYQLVACMDCPEYCWADSDYGYALLRPFRSLFFGIYGKYRRMLRESPEVRRTRSATDIEMWYRIVSRVDRALRDELDEALDTFRTWNWRA